MKNLNNQKIWILGASAGLGSELAKILDFDGAEIAISARSESDLLLLGNSLVNKPLIRPLDVTDVSQIASAFQSILSEWKTIDRIVYLPAIYNPMKLSRLNLDIVQKEIEVNLLGLFNMISVVLPVLQKQKQGQFLICSSVAGFVGLPMGQPYSATKAAVTNVAESLKCENPNLDIKIIHPGFIKTRLTDQNNFKMPMIMDAEVAAYKLYKGMLKNKFEISFPWAFVATIKLIRILPYSVFFKIFKAKKH